MMTRKHFVAMAATIALIKPIADRKQVAERNAKFCKLSNKRFDKARFMAACGIK